MRHYQFHIGDYSAHTGHLSPMEDLAYRRLLDLYYITERPLPESIEECAKKIRMREHTSEVKAVLEEFFELTQEGWYSKRCEQEIEYCSQISGAGKKGANARWKKKKAQKTQAQCDTDADAMPQEDNRNATLMRPHCDSDATAMRLECDRNATPDEVAVAPNTQYPIPINQYTPPIVPPLGGGSPPESFSEFSEKQKTVPAGGEGGVDRGKNTQDLFQAPENTGPPPGVRGVGTSGAPSASRRQKKPKKAEWFCDVEKPDDVSAQTWSDYCVHRKEKGVSITKTSINLARREAGKADITIEKALAMTVGMGWKGFLAIYYESRNRTMDGQRRCQLPPGVI